MVPCVFFEAAGLVFPNLALPPPPLGVGPAVASTPPFLVPSSWRDEVADPPRSAEIFERGLDEEEAVLVSRVKLGMFIIIYCGCHMPIYPLRSLLATLGSHGRRRAASLAGQAFSLRQQR